MTYQYETGNAILKITAIHEKGPHGWGLGQLLDMLWTNGRTFIKCGMFN